MNSNKKSRPNNCKEVPERFNLAEDPDIPCFQYDQEQSDPKIIFSQHYDVYEEDGQRSLLTKDYHNKINDAFLEVQKKMKELEKEKGEKLRGEYEKLKEIF